MRHEDRLHHIGDLACGGARLSACSRCRRRLPSDVADVEALPVDIVPMEASRRSSRATRRPCGTKPAPVPTQQPANRTGRAESRRQQRRYRQAGNAGAKPKPVDDFSAAASPDADREAQAETCRSRRTSRSPFRHMPGRQPKEEARAGQAGGPKPTPASRSPAAGQDRGHEPSRGQADAVADNARAAERERSCRTRRPRRKAAEAAAGPGRKRQGAGHARMPTSRSRSREQAEIGGQAVQRRRDLRPARQAEAVRRRRQALDQQAALGGDKPTNPQQADPERGWMHCAARCSAAGTSRPARRTPRTCKVSVQFKLDPSGALAGHAAEIISGGGSSGVARRRREPRVRAVAQLRALQSAGREIRRLGRRHRQFRSQRDVLKTAAGTWINEAYDMKRMLKTLADDRRDGRRHERGRHAAGTWRWSRSTSTRATSSRCRSPSPISRRGDALGAQISGVVAADLKRSGLFAPIDKSAFIEKISNPDAAPRFEDWKVINAQALVTGSVGKEADGRAARRVPAVGHLCRPAAGRRAVLRQRRRQLAARRAYHRRRHL